MNRTPAAVNRPAPTSGRTMAGAFTLIELLVVIAIIAILMSAALLVGKHVRAGGQNRTTEDTIRVLDQSLTAYESSTGGLPGPKFTYSDVVGNEKNNKWDFPMFDGRLDGSDFSIDSVQNVQSLARYAAEAAKSPEADSLIRSINSRFVTRIDLKTSDETGAKNPTKLPSSVRIIDAFGRPIRFVHPSMDGGFGSVYAPTLKRSGEFLKITSRTGGGEESMNYRRSARPFDAKIATSGQVGDADEGICAGERPYFYSAGMDGDPGTRENNIYTTKPTYPAETASLK